MTKTKRQLRAEAVERLKKPTSNRDRIQVMLDVSDEYWWNMSDDLITLWLIDLLTDDEHDDGLRYRIIRDGVYMPNVKGCELRDTDIVDGVDEPDSREKLDADIWYFIEHNGWFGYEYEAESYADCRKAIFKIFKEWLDRQAAITEREWEADQSYLNAGYKERIDELTAERDGFRRYIDDVKSQLEQTQEWRNNWRRSYYEVDEERDKLTDERDHLRRQVDMLNAQVIELTAERDAYREKLSRALDLAHEIGRLQP